MKVRLNWMVGIPFLAVGILQEVCAATTYYVAPNGNDGNPGTSPEQPWRTIQRAVNQPVVPGDSVMVFDGTYMG